jgi:hypothetical protein
MLDVGRRRRFREMEQRRARRDRHHHPKVPKDVGGKFTGEIVSRKKEGQ